MSNFIKRRIGHKLSTSDGSIKRILVADDYAITRQLVTQFLAGEDLLIDLATNGQEVLELTRNTRYGLILMDCNMPEVDGIEATRKLRGRGYDLPIVAMSAHIDSRIYEDCQAAGMNDYLMKPFRSGDLKLIVYKWLADVSDLCSNECSEPN